MCLGIGCCIGSAICCAGAMCCKCLCYPAKMAGVAAKNYAKIGYVVFSISWIIFTILFMLFMNWLFDWSDNFGFDCPIVQDGGNNKACAGSSTLVRTSWSLAIFHIIMLIIVSLRNDFAASFHDGCWGAKALIVAGIMMGSLWIPNDPVMNGYLEFARIVSVIFLLYQAIMILVLSYGLNDLLVSNVEKEGGSVCTTSGIILIVIFVLTTCGNIVWLVFQYKEFGKEGCGANLTFLIISTVIAVFTYVIVIFRTRPDASMLTSSIIWSYHLYLQWSAMSSNPSTECNKFQNSAGNTTGEICVGLFFTFLALVVIGGSTTKETDSTVTGAVSAHMMEKEEDVQPKNQNYSKVGQPTDLEGTGKKEKVKMTEDDMEKNHIFPISTATIVFQGLMVLASIYYSMLMTNWGKPSVEDSTFDGFFNNGPMSYWV